MRCSFSRVFSMPSKHTFSIPAISEFIQRWHKPESVDPFCGESKIATVRNDLSTGLDAREFLSNCQSSGMLFSTAILDPPYSPRQISECYKSIGLKASSSDTQNARLYRECRELMKEMLLPDGIALQFGWNSCGWGEGFYLAEVLIVNHGGAHNDTICTAWIKTDQNQRGSNA